MTFSFYTHYFTLFTLIAHWIAVTILSCQSHKTACYLKLPGWWFANLAIAVAYLPWLPVLFNLLTHLAQLRAGNDIGWIPPVTWRDLPAMYWHFLPETTDRVFRRSFCGWLWEVLSVLWGEYLYATENMKDIS